MNHDLLRLIALQLNEPDLFTLFSIDSSLLNDDNFWMIKNKEFDKYIALMERIPSIAQISQLEYYSCLRFTRRFAQCDNLHVNGVESFTFRLHQMVNIKMKREKSFLKFLKRLTKFTSHTLMDCEVFITYPQDIIFLLNLLHISLIKDGNTYSYKIDF